MRTLSLGLLASLLLLSACGKDEDTASDIDADADGYTEDVDCNDRDPLIHPDANETCDGRDNDCDGDIDEGATVPLYFDADLDGYGDPDLETTGCPGTAGYSREGTDCDDEDAQVHPDAEEWCDGLDNDCDDEIDEDIEYADWYADEDLDGYGDPGEMVNACMQPEGYIEDGTDCDDGDDAIHPEADEYCDEIDNDCDGEIDEADALDTLTWYPDQDGDGFGDALAKGTLACAAGSDEVLDHTDCDDQSADINPDGTEICDDGGADEDCDGLVDDADASTATASMTSWHPDVDGDGFGDTSSSTLACTVPSGHTADDRDCDDSDGSINPAMAEICNGGVDDDCDGMADDMDSPVLGTSTWYADADGDRYGDAGSSREACEQPRGYVADNTDCDDTDANLTTDCPEDTGDTGEAFTRDGSYLGTIVVAVEIPAMSLTDTCSGTAEIEVVESDTTPITGIASCSFSGPLAALLGAQDATLEGEITTDPDVEGTLEVSSGGMVIISDDWIGEFTDDDTLFGVFDGTASYSGMPVLYEGEIEVIR
jgi:hypothetical protein